MSGPKTSHYTLTPEQRRILEEQRQIRVACELLEKQKKDARGVVERTDRMVEQLEPLLLELGMTSEVLEQAKVLRTKAADAISQTAQASDSEGLQRLKETNQTLGTATFQLDALAPVLKRELHTAEQAFSNQANASIDSGFDLSFDAVGASRGKQGSALHKKIADALDAVAELMISAAQRQRLCAIREKACQIEDEGFLKNYYAMTVTPFVKDCRAYHDLYTAHAEQFYRKRFEYEANAKTLGITAEEIPFSAEAIALLDAKLRETQAAIRFKEEQAYISRCVDEAMEELGYSVLGRKDVVKRSGKRFHNALYLFDEGTAVNVIYSNDGQITMELGGLDNQNRAPTVAESESLAADMQAFCTDYSEIEKRLRQKGVVTKRICVLPADPQYATIIDVSDYDLCEDISEFDMEKRKKQTTEVKTQKLGE